MTRSPVAHSTPTGAVNFAPANSSSPCGVTTCSAPWGKSAPPGTNAAMESFFYLLQRNVMDRQRWATRDDLRIAIVTWIERTYHRCR
ncbi:hypothetical protein NJB1907f44_46540 [Mycobacterium marinum]|uniref:Integrase catalytic domain-containing protein n=1 Tax=Mycobacterium shottsii TaxID=133549 RepID=A0A7I7LIB0_9MYCO|nr:hypothetical protein MMRN_36410 [Mycobacterium marinum]BBX59565.1 hypothetical protein MSHO_49100 [Mycobacterium shottsii]GJN97662.1 hypothetical protein NJB1808e29_14020 [Mycobacterium marinum]GJN98376.1 hypothetical protein NJB1907f34b_09690 [Mycobacterium marinum]GJO19276.1 hypothetical protein NJB1907E90_49500 [Mycobacterium marinum]